MNKSADVGRLRHRRNDLAAADDMGSLIHSLRMQAGAESPWHTAMAFPSIGMNTTTGLRAGGRHRPGAAKGT